RVVRTILLGDLSWTARAPRVRVPVHDTGQQPPRLRALGILRLSPRRLGVPRARRRAHTASTCPRDAARSRAREPLKRLQARRDDDAMNRNSFATTLAVCVALVAVAMLFWRQHMMLSAHESFNVLTNADFFTQIYPMEHRATALLQDWTIPLWNPFQFCGH